MIKLIDILNEGISNVLTNETSENNKAIDEIAQACIQMGASSPLIYRGMRTKFLLSKVDNQRISFRGGNLGAKTILSELGVQYPLFGYSDPVLVEFFGIPRVVVLKQPYKIFQSPEVRDVMAYAQYEIYSDEKTDSGVLRKQTGTRSDEEIIEKAKEGAKTYKEVSSSSIIENREIVMDAQEYWTVSLLSLIDRGGKFMPSSINTYGELAKGLEVYKKFLAYRLARIS
jgi:hypothetical protein